MCQIMALGHSVIRLECIPRCPICFELISEPVVFPCEHEVCRGCFDKSLETANHCCPLCRKRVSSWARKNAKNPINDKRRREIHEYIAQLDKENVVNNDDVKPCHGISSPGEIRAEYLSEMQKVQAERSAEETQGEAKAQKLHLQELRQSQIREAELARCNEISEVTARSLQEEELKQELLHRQQLQDDHVLAQLLSQEFHQCHVEDQDRIISKDREMAEKLHKEESSAKEMMLNDRLQKNKQKNGIKRISSGRKVIGAHSTKLYPRPITFWLKPSK